MRKKVLYTAISLALASPVVVHAGDAQDDPEAHHTEVETIVVRALPLDRTKLESAQPVDVLTGEKLDDRRGVTLGETLAREPGVHSTAYGAGAGRPVIRGLGGPRVRVLEDGLYTADTSVASDDHAVTVDPLLVDRIEILRGPATLLYGSGAVGGVVNIIDNRIPERVPERAITGRYELRGDTVADERSGVFGLTGGAGNFAWHVDGSWRDADDYKIPGPARMEDDHDHDHGHDHDDGHGSDRLENSFVESQSGTIGLSWIGERGFIGASFRAFDTEYGIPAPHEHGDDHDDHGHDHAQHALSRSYLLHDHDHDHDNDHEEDEFVFVDMKQRRWDLKGGLDNPLPGFSRGRLRMSYNDYEHIELPVESHGHDSDHDHGHAMDHDHGHGHDHDHDHFTEFHVETFQTRMELEHEPIAGWRGALGLQFENEKFEAEGAEAFVPDGETRSIGLFGLEERRFGDLTLSFGGRVERTRVALRDHHDDDHDHDHSHGHALMHDHDHDHDHGYDDDHHDIDERTFTAWSVSAGGVWQMSEQWQSSLNFSRAQRAPSHTELFADGPHLATFAFERGDAMLGKETTNGLDFIFHRHGRDFDFEVSLFYNDISDYIFLAETGETHDGLPVRQFDQRDAEFYGLEAGAVWHFEDTGFGHFDLRASFDTVRGRLDFGDNLPRISPTRIGGGVDWYLGGWRASADLTRFQRQSKVADFESETPGYNMLDLRVGYNFFLAGIDMEAFVQGRNLLDEEARVHTSHLKEFAPLPGRNFRFGLRGRF